MPKIIATITLKIIIEVFQHSLFTDSSSGFKLTLHVLDGDLSFMIDGHNDHLPSQEIRDHYGFDQSLEDRQRIAAVLSLSCTRLWIISK